MLNSHDIYCRILGVEPYASISEIKRAFRKKAKTLHPDTSVGKDSNANIKLNKEMTKLLEAYKAVLSEHKSLEGDFPFSGFQKKSRFKEFDYRSWLKEHDDYESKTKLIVFDLFHDLEDEAVAEYLQLIHKGYKLIHFLEQTDFMDCGFVLAEELYFRDYFFESFELLIPVIEMENECDYFKHFFPEVLKLARNILIGKLYRVCDCETVIEFYDIALGWGFTKNDKAKFSKHIAEAYFKLGDIKTANFYLDKMIRFMPRMKKPNWVKEKTFANFFN
ncbi:MAG: hypothetical protein CR988_08155 [Treponema sp.]|nr:MAG: hypothetical protein CR988_08155 [Treponema sp.]